MKKYWIPAIALLLTLNSSAQRATHVVVITIDGFRPDFYLDTSWHTPHLRTLLREGAHAKGVTGVFPSMTYPSHTTIVTGVKPAQHGVYYNSMFRDTGWAKDIYWQDSSIHQPTLWEAVHARGQKVATLFWPVSAGAPVDYNIPDIGGLGETIRAQYAVPNGIIDDLKKHVFNGAAEIEYGKDQNVARIAAYVIQKEAPTLTTMHLFSVDHAQHVQGRSGTMVEEAVADADEAVAIVIDALKQKGIWDSTLLIVTGDHGFVTVTQKLNPNAWLKKAGLLNNRATGDWKAQFFYSSGAAFLYLKNKNDQQTLDKVNQLLQSLPDSSKKLFRIVNRKQLDKAIANPEVALALSGENGSSFDGIPDGPAVVASNGGTHGYFPDFAQIRTGFIARGPGIKAGGVTTEMSLCDIAPLVAAMLGLDFPSAAGRLPKALLQ